MASSAVPTGIVGTHKLADGKDVVTKEYKAVGTEVAALFFLHGFSDHVDRYKDLLFPQLATAGITVYSYDQRGWGRSVATPADKGLTGPSEQVLSDIVHLVSAHLPSPVPFFLMGHSMGGLNTVWFLSHAPKDITHQISGYILSSPFIGFAKENEPPRLKVIAGRIAGRVLPKMQLVNRMDEGWMSHDPVANKSWKDDELCHDTGTLEGLAGMIDRTEQLNSGRVKVEVWDELNVLCIHGDQDKATSCDASRKWFDALPATKKEYKLYEGGYHCLFAEPDLGDRYRTDVINFVLTTAKEKQAANDAQSKL